MSSFPLLILLVPHNKRMLVRTPKELPNGVAFKVLKTCCGERKERINVSAPILIVKEADNAT